MDKSILKDRRKRINKVIKALDKLKKEYPDQEMYMETPKGTVSCKLGDALIFYACDGSIAIDSE